MAQKRRVVITRPQEDGAEFAVRLSALGFVSVIAPLMTIRFVDGPIIALDGVQAIAATSASGVRALARRTTNRDLPMFAVGQATARAAGQAGFSRVHAATGDVGGLADCIAGALTPDGGTIFHAAARDLAGDLGGMLVGQGFFVRREILYAAEAVDALPVAISLALGDDPGLAISFFSPRTASIFAACAGDLTRQLSLATAIALSDNVAALLGEAGFGRILVAKAPTEDALVAALVGLWS